MAMRTFRRFQDAAVHVSALRRCRRLDLLQGYHSRRTISWLAPGRRKFDTKAMTFSVRYVTTTKVPNMGDSISEGTLVEWTKKVGEYCKVDDVVAVIETDKVSIDVRTDVAGVITEHLAAVDDTLEVGAPLFKIDPSAKPVEAPPGQKSADAAPKAKEQPTAAAAAAASGGAKKEAAPAAAAAAAAPKPESKGGDKKATTPASSSSSSSSSPSIKSREERREPMSRMRQRIAQRLKESQTRAAALTTFNEIDMSVLTAMRAKHKEIFLEKHGVKLGFMSAFVKASVSALREQPTINAYFDDERKEIVFHDYCDVSVAVASPTGLVVPVIRNAETLSFSGVEKQIQEYANKAKKGTLSLDEMTGGTFTISNGGVFGSLMGTPILNPPQSAILGMHGVFERPVAIDGKVEVRPMMFVALTYDHRIVDGREAVLFLRRVKETIEDPHRLLLDC